MVKHIKNHVNQTTTTTDELLETPTQSNEKVESIQRKVKTKKIRPDNQPPKNADFLLEQCLIKNKSGKTPNKTSQPNLTLSKLKAKIKADKIGVNHKKIFFFNTP